MYTVSSDAVEEPTAAFEWRVWGSDSCVSTPVMPLGNARDASLHSMTATNKSFVPHRGDSRDDRGVTAATSTQSTSAFSRTPELAQMASAASSWSSVAVTNNTRGTGNATYKGAHASSGAITLAGLMTLTSEGKCTSLQNSSAVSEDLSSHSERVSGGIGSSADVNSFKCTTTSLAVEAPHSKISTTLRDSDDGDDEAFSIIKESIKRQLVSIDEDECANETTHGNLAAALRQTLQPQPQQHRYLTVQLRSGAASEADGVRRSGSDNSVIHISSPAAPPAPRSAAAAAAARQGERTTICCSSSPGSVVEQLAAISIGQSSVGKASVRLASASSSGTKGSRLKAPPSQQKSPQASTPKATRLTSQHSLEHQPPKLRAPATAYPLNATASRATLFDQHRQPSVNGVGGPSFDVSPRVEASIHAVGLRIPLPTFSVRAAGDGSGSGEIAHIQVAEAPCRTHAYVDPSRDMGSGAATATARSLTTSTTTSSSSTSTTLQSACFSSERSSSSKDEPSTAGHHYHQYPLQPRSCSSMAQLRHGPRPHQPEIPALQLEGLQEQYASRNQQERLHRNDTQKQQQEQLPVPPPLTPPSQPQQRVQASSLISFQSGPRFPNLPPHLQPQRLTQTQQQSHLPQQLPQTQPQQSQQQLGVSASSSSAAMIPGKIYAATPHGRLILLTPDGVRVPQVQQPQHSLPPPPPPPPPLPPPSTSTTSTLTGNYVTASNYSALFCRNNPLHSMRYPGSQSESAGRLMGEAARAKDEKVTSATLFSSAERSSTQAPSTTGRSAASEKDVSASLTVGKSRDNAAANHTESRISVTPAVATTGSTNAEETPLPTGRSAVATGASATTDSAATMEGSSTSSVTASASCDSQLLSASVAPLLARGSHGPSAGELAQRLGSHPSSSSTVNEGGRPLQLPTREDTPATSFADGANHPNLTTASVSASRSSGASMSSLSRAQPTLVDSDRNIGLSMANTVVMPASSTTAEMSHAHVAVPSNSSGTAVTDSQGGAVAGEHTGSSSKAPRNSCAFVPSPTGLKPPNSGFGADATGASNGAHAAHFTHSTSQPALSVPASSASYSALAALGSAHGGGAAKCNSTPAPLRQELTGNSRFASCGDVLVHAAKPTGPDAVSSPLKQSLTGAPPPQHSKQQHLYIQALSSATSTAHASGGGRLHVAADDSIVVTIPVTGADGSITAAVITVPPPFSYSEAGVQQYCLGALQQQHTQQQRPHSTLQQQPLPAPPQQQHSCHQGALAEEQSTPSCAGEAVEWRRKQDLITLQLEQHRQRLENELRQVQLQQAQQQQQLQHAQHHHNQNQQQQTLKHQQTLPPAQTTMVTIDGRLYRMLSTSSGESLVNCRQPCRDLHFVNRDALFMDGAVGADGRTEAASLHLSNHHGVCMPISPQAQLSPPQQQQQHMLIAASSDGSALGEATSAGALLTTSSSPAANVLLVMPTPPTSHKLQYGY